MAKPLGTALLSVTMIGCGFGAVPAAADAVADFYKGKQIRFVVRTTVGGDYDQYTRLIARFMGKHIPGNPSMVVVNIPGGGGIAAANYMAHVAPRDGTVIGIVGQGLAMDQALGASPQLKADLREFNWIANVIYSNQLLLIWHTSPTRTVEDAKRRVTTIGTTGAGSVSVQYPAFYNNVLGTQFKIVSGYPGGQEIDLAMERGEVEGRGTTPYSSLMATKPTWLRDKKVIPWMQAGIEKEPALPDVPLILDQKVRAEDRPLLQFMADSSSVGRPLATTPGVPAERVAALRQAFDATARDPDFIAASKKEGIDINPQSAEVLTRIILGLINAPQDVRDRMKVALQPRPEHTQEVRAK